MGPCDFIKYAMNYTFIFDYFSIKILSLSQINFFDKSLSLAYLQKYD